MIEQNPIFLREISVLLLAGGLGSRMGGRDKGLIQVEGKPAIEHVLDRIQPQSKRIIISANRNLDEYAAYGYPVVRDSISGFPGPLAGMLAGLDICETRCLLTLPVDTPFISENFPARMKTYMDRHSVPACVAEYEGQLEPVFCLLDRRVKDSLREFLNQGQRSARDWLRLIGAKPMDCSDIPDQFINLNCPEDIHKLTDKSIREN